MADISWPKDTLVKLIRRGSEEIIPNGQTTIAAGDMLVLAVDSGKYYLKMNLQANLLFLKHNLRA